jgi:hypothetical protein
LTLALCAAFASARLVISWRQPPRRRPTWRRISSGLC